MNNFIPSLERLLAASKENQATNPFASQVRFHDGYVLALEHALELARLHQRLDTVTSPLAETPASLEPWNR